ncbi:putative ubiquinone biosynthesis protein mitochondrial precursor [Phaeomoniella chlamydospora]|uniref:Ubiquinone biosynthesis protein n=1 Tax=Phaeomoniella chlamydospora TaxID=158046 RepID=A0A0G2DZS6_PHACM|nr:putative ubiquinone biosynthesis protein mitochondrial precursor [Phaeomoniella chlamydospora]
MSRRLSSKLVPSTRFLQSTSRSYYSAAFPDEPPCGPTQSKILSHALSHVPKHGFSQHALLSGARDAGYLDVSVQLFPRGAFDLLNYYRVTRRLALKDRVQFDDERAKLGIGRKVRLLTRERLRLNVEDGIVGQLQGALALSSLAGNIPQSLKELSLLSDEIWYLASDTDVTFSWYSKRASLAAIYASTELFMSTDKSKDFQETDEFLDRRLNDVMTVGKAVSGAREYIGFWAGSALNVGRSLGMRI